MSDQPIKPLFAAAASTSPEAASAAVVAETPLAGALTTTFRFLYLAVAVLAVVWLATGIKSVEPGTQAVVFRLGAIDRVITSGLVLALPQPIEEVALIPSGERQLTLDIDRLDLNNRADGTAVITGTGIDPRKDGGYALTGDAGVVHLRAMVTYQVADARVYAVAQLNRAGVEAAVRRIVQAAIIAACAGRTLDGVMVASPDSLDGQASESVALSRERLRSDIVANANQRLTGLADLGLHLTRADLTAYLPDRAKPSFDAVIAAEGSAAKDIAESRTAAAKLAADSAATRAGILAAADAKAQEITAGARIATDRVRSLLAESDPERRRLVLARLYQERMEGILRSAGGVVTVPAGDSARIVVPGR